MSRAFVKEADGRPEPPPPRPVSERPNYVTARGLELLQSALAKAQAENDERNVRYFTERIDSATVVKPPKSPKVVRFGCTVTVRERGGKTLQLRIVGEDEADPAHGAISWSSPYAQALLDHRTGERVVVARPAGNATVEIASISGT